MTVLGTVVLFVAFASIQAAVLPAIASPYIPSLPPYIDVLPPIVDYQAYSSLSCGCNNPSLSCGCSPPYGYGPPTVITTPLCGCSSTVDCRVPTCTSLPVASPTVPCGCGGPTVTYSSCGCGSVPTVPYSSCACGGVPTVPYYPPVGCGCGLTTPLTPPLPPVIGCPKYLRQVCVQPPFL